MGSVEKTQSSFWKAWKLKLEEQKQLADRGRQIEQLIPGVDSSRFLSGDINYIEESILLFVDSVRLKKTHILKSVVELADEHSVQRSKVSLFISLVSLSRNFRSTFSCRYYYDSLGVP